MSHWVFIKIRKDFSISEEKLSLIINKNLSKRGASGSIAELWVVGKKRMKTLNNQFMHKNYPTDVLSFPLDKIPAEDRLGFKLIGTIVLCNDIIVSDAKKSGNSFLDETSELISHGVDHLLGIHHK